MAQQFPDLTVEDFGRIPWQAVIQESGDHECYAYAGAFYGKAKDCDECADVLGREAFTLLGHCAGLMLESSNPNEPFQSALISRTGRSSMLEDIAASDLNVLRQLAPQVEDAEFRARLADIVWVTKQDFLSAQIAFEAYLDSASHLDAKGKWLAGKDRLERASRLAAKLGNGGRDQRQAVVDHIEAVLKRHDADNRERHLQPARLMSLLLEFGAGDGVQWAALARNKAEQSEALRGLHWETARDYWLLAAEWATRQGDAHAAHEASMRAAHTFVEIAQELLARERPDHIGAAIHIQRALEALRQLEETSRAKDLHGLLLDQQPLASAQMQSFSHSVDVSEFARKMIDAVRDKSFFEAIIVLIGSISGPKVDQLRQRATERSDDQLFMDLIATHERVDSRGRVVGRRPNRNADDPREVEAAIEADMFDEALRYQHIIVAAQIEPARFQIGLDHRVKEVDLLALLRYSPFVPANREILFAKGLRAGFLGEFIESSHLLTPQIENSIRELLNQRSVITSSLTSEGVQEDFDLRRLLSLAETREMLGDDLTFDLRGLLVERFGSNLRNRLAHGLLDQYEFYSFQAAYLWWTALRLCFLPILRPTASADTDGGEPV